MKIIVSGSVAYDRIMDFPGKFQDHIIPSEIRQLNVSFMVREFRETFGGAAGNIAYNLALLKEKPIIYSAAGRDFEKYQQWMAKSKVDFSGIKLYPQTLTAAAYIITDKNDNQITGFFPGAMNFYGKRPRPNQTDLAIISPGNPNEMMDLADCYSKSNLNYIFDPGQQIIQFTKRQLNEIISRAMIYIINDYELALTLKLLNCQKSKLVKSAGILVTTFGKNGSLIEIKNSNKYKRVKVRAIKTPVAKDPTGAGDAYRAGLIKGITHCQSKLIKENVFKWPWQQIGQSASLAAVYAVEQYGTQNHFYTFSQFKKRYKLTFKQKYD